MERPERYPSGYFIPGLIEDEDIIFNKDSEYHKQKKKEKKNPIFKRNKSKNRWVLQGGHRMSITLNSTIGALVLAIGKIIVESDGKTNTAMLEIPDQDFYLEIAVKLKKEATE